jgi:hypothetical protein
MSAFTDKVALWIRLKTKSFGYRFMRVPSPQQWVFIVGCYNSGTTLLHQLLSKHPLIGSMPNEGQFYTDQLPRGAQIGLPRLWAMRPEVFHLTESSTPPVNVSKMLRDWAWFYNDPSKPVLVEKTILNAARTRWLQKVLPNASFIVLYRNGYAVAEGIHRKEGHSLQIAARQWSVSNRMLSDDLHFIHRKHIVRYEDLVKDPESVLMAVTKFIGIDPVPDSVFRTTYRVHKVESGIRDMNAESIARLTAEEIKEIEEEAGEMLKELGYALP